MQFITGIPSGVISDAQEVVEIKLWETYLLHTRTNLPNLLNQTSIDHGPVQSINHEPGRVIYRFSALNWESAIKQVLYENRIPVVVRPSRNGVSKNPLVYA